MATAQEDLIAMTAASRAGPAGGASDPWSLAAYRTAGSRAYHCQ
jgi:hypothetical protein